MPLLNYTTTIAVDKTVGEIQTALAKIGASRILIEYTEGEVNALAFELHERRYRLPCRFQAVQKTLESDPNVPRRLQTPSQARRVAWRVLKSWVEAQIAIIQTKMVNVDEVFLPYQIAEDGLTVYEHYAQNNRLLSDKGGVNE